MNLLKNNFVLRLIQSSPAYFSISVAALLSGIGSALTVIAVNAEFSKWQLPSHYYALASAFSILPGVFASEIGKLLIKKYSWVKMFVAAELAGLIGLFVVWLGFQFSNVFLLLTGLFVSSVLAGVMIPISQTFSKENVPENRLTDLGKWSVWLFSANFIFGEALGAIFQQIVEVKVFLYLDAFTYLIAMLIVVLSYQKWPEIFGSSSVEKRSELKKNIEWNTYSFEKKKAFLVNPVLALVCAPLMSLLAAIGAQKGSIIKMGPLLLNPAVTILLFKTLGQMLGPFFFDLLKIDEKRNSRFTLVTLLGLYVLFYAVAIFSTNFWISALGVTLAHIFSNVVFVVGFTAFISTFSKEEYAAVTVRHYQLTVAVMTISAFVASGISRAYEIKGVLFYSVLVLMAVTYQIIKRGSKNGKI
jgi:MFS family permease